MSSLVTDPAVLVVFGASGDLTRRKLLPAIHNLAEAHHLADRFAIIGVARPAMDDHAFRAEMRARVEEAEQEPLAPATWRPIEDRLHYLSGEFGDPALYERLRQAIERLRQQHDIPPNVLFYLATPPDMFGIVARQLADAGLTAEDHGWRRIIVEKPFGYDLTSARALNEQLMVGLRESQIYRIDH